MSILVEEGVDVAVRIGELADSSLIAVRLGRSQPRCGREPRLSERAGRSEVAAELAKHDIIAFEGLDAPPNEWRFHGGGKPVRLEPRLTVNSVDASIAAAEAGIGITRTLSYQVQASVIAGRLMPILQQFAPPPLPVSAIYPARRITSANIAVFMKTARDYFRAHPLVPVEEWRRRTKG